MDGQSDGAKTMGFMQPEIYRGRAYVVECCHGETHVVPADVAGDVDSPDGTSWDADDKAFESLAARLRDYLPGQAESIEIKAGWLGRYQAPGYLDCTEWALYATAREAREELAEMYGDGTEEE